MRRFCAICGCVVADLGYAFCVECRSDLSAMGCTDRHALKPVSEPDEPVVEAEAIFGENPRPRFPPPTVEYRNTAPNPYKFGMALLVSACISAGFIAGFLVRGM